jgi:hypothetical protein
MGLVRKSEIIGVRRIVLSQYSILYALSRQKSHIISSNMDIGSHGWGHVDWRRVDDKMLDVEFDEALKKIADTLGCAIAKVSNRIRELRSSSRASIVTQRGKDGLHERWGPRSANRMDAASRVFQNLVG